MIDEIEAIVEVWMDTETATSTMLANDLRDAGIPENVVSVVMLEVLSNNMTKDWRETLRQNPVLAEASGNWIPTGLSRERIDPKTYTEPPPSNQEQIEELIKTEYTLSRKTRRALLHIIQEVYRLGSKY